MTSVQQLTRDILTGAKRRILVVEDDPDASEAICMILSVLGHECHAAFTGAEALDDEVTAFDPDLAIIDLSLPDVSGYEVCRALRTHLSSRVHFVALTGWGGPEHESKVLAAGFDQHVLKPAGADALRRIVAVANGNIEATPQPNALGR